MDARETIEAYYDALRAGEALSPFFAGGEVGDDATVKFGISVRLVGIDEIEAGLREQTRTTADWVVESRELRVSERDRHAWFSDDVSMAWTDTERGIRFEFETRWSGTLARRAADQGGDAWRFVGMHVSTAGEV